MSIFILHYHNLVGSVFVKSVHKNICSTRLTFITCIDSYSKFASCQSFEKKIMIPECKQLTSKCKKKKRYLPTESNFALKMSMYNGVIIDQKSEDSASYWYIDLSDLLQCINLTPSE